MATPILDFSHLTPEERIELAEQLWDSLDPQHIAASADQVAELRRRRAELDSDGNIGEPGDHVLEDIAELELGNGASSARFRQVSREDVE